MKTLYHILFLFFTATILSCGNKSEKSETTVKSVNTESKEPEVEKNVNDDKNITTDKSIEKMNPNFSYIIGTWNGKLRDKNLKVVIENIQGDVVTGYNIAGNNRRAVSGTIMEDDRPGGGECMGNQISYKVILNEPGNDKWDGFFTLYFTDCPELDENMERVIGHSFNGYGQWKAYSGKLSGDIRLTK